MSKLLTVNGAIHTVDVEPSTPLLYVLRNDLGLQGPRFGCGLGQCGACTVIINGTAGVPMDRAVGGALTNNCGAWDAVVYAHSGDVLNITYDVGDQTSLPTAISPP